MYGGEEQGFFVSFLEVLGVDDARAGVLAGLQLDAGDEPAAGPGGVVVERGAVSVLGVLGEDDGGALEVQGPLARFKVQLGFVAPPRAVLHCHDRLAVGGHRGNQCAVHLVPVVLV